MISWNEPKFGEREKELVNKVLDSGYVSEGPMTKKLEKELAKVVGAKHVIMTTSCTAALYLAIEADKKIRKYTEGEVIIPDLTFVGTKNAVEMAGLKLHISDVRDNFTVGNISKGVDNLKIVIPVNLLGRSWLGSITNKLTKIKEFSEDIVSYGCIGDLKGENITVICDNAGALGSDVPIGKVGCYSLQGNKIISCGQGGFCATDDDEYAEKIRQLKDHGREGKFDNDTIGFNFKFNDILAAVALGQLEKLEDRKELLVNQYKRYKKELSGCGKFITFSLTEVPLWVEFECEHRDELFDYLESKGISCRKPWKPFEFLENSAYYYDNVLWLPNGPTLKDYNQTIIVDYIKEFYDEIKKNT